MQGTEVLGVRFAPEERAAYAKRGARTSRGVVILGAKNGNAEWKRNRQDSHARFKYQFSRAQFRPFLEIVPHDDAIKVTGASRPVHPGLPIEAGAMKQQTQPWSLIPS